MDGAEIATIADGISTRARLCAGYIRKYGAPQQTPEEQAGVFDLIRDLADALDLLARRVG